MRDFLSWNVSLGRWGGVAVRVHVLFLLFAVIALYLGSQEADMLAYAVLALAILLVSVLLHEMGHCLAARRLGGDPEQVLLWPLGGLVHAHGSHDPREELLTTLAGPVTNATICLAATPVLLLQGADVAPLLNPLNPPVPGAISLQNVLETAFWLNWLLVLVNLVPAFPMDGGRALRCLLWPRFGYRRAVLLVARTAMITAIALPLLAWAFGLYATYPHAWAPLVIFGIFLFFSARQEIESLAEHDPEDGFFGYDFSQGYTSLERGLDTATPFRRSPLRRWLAARRAARLERRMAMEADEERRVDSILARLHETGMEGLSSEDRALLSRVSRRYRDQNRS